MKFLGALLLVLSCLALGVKKAAGQARRARNLAELGKALELMSGEIYTRLIPLPELVGRLASELRGAVGRFFENLSRRMPELGDVSFAGLWAQAVLDTPELDLRPAEADELRLVGMSLGRFGAEEQKTALDAGVRRFGGFAEAAAEEAKTGRRLYAGLGLAAGLMLAIVLM